MNFPHILLLVIFIGNIIVGILNATSNTNNKDKSGWFWGVGGWICAVIYLLVSAGILK
jgi:hypothetical protein